MAIKAGPKAALTAEPLDFTGWPTDRAERRIKFIETYLVVPHGKGAGGPFTLREWQKEIIRGAYAPGIRTALVSLPRGNGKTGLAAALGVAEAFLEPYSPQVLIVAADQRQASVCMRAAKRMIQLSPELAARSHEYRDRIEVPETDAVLMALPSDPDSLQGWRPTLMVCDELHTWTTETWEAVSSATGKTEQSLTLAISTPGVREDCIMHKLVQHGRSKEDPAFYLREYAAPNNCTLDDRDAWRAANPALGDFLFEDGMLSARRTLREPAFRVYRLGQWMAGVDAWLPYGAWSACRDDERVPMPGDRITLGFDGSVSGDDTVIVACTVPAGPDDKPFIWTLGHWSNPARGSAAGKEWRVPRHEVLTCVEEAFSTYDVALMGADPAFWRTEVEAWQREHGKDRVLAVEWGYRKRQAAMLDRFYQAVQERHLAHDGDEQLAAHMAHAIAVPTAQGDIIAKPSEKSRDRIDLCVGAVIAFDQAIQVANKPAQPKPRRRRVVTFR